MDDCAEKLRESADYLDLCLRQGLMYQAANHVEQLEAQNERLEKALREATEYECAHAWEAPCGNCAYCVCAAALVEGKE